MSSGPRISFLRCLAVALAVVVLLSPLRALAEPSHRAAALVVDATVDRTTPRRALRSFLDAAREGDFTAASHCMDLGGLADSGTGPELAEELSYVLYRRPAIDLTAVPDEPTVPDGRVVVETFTAGEQEIPLTLVRETFDDGIARWVLSRSTVKHIPDIAATLRTAVWEQRLPRPLRWPVILGNAPWQWLGLLVGLFVCYAVGRLAAAVVTRVGASLARRTSTMFDDALVRATNRPLRTILTSALFGGLAYVLQLSLAVERVAQHLSYTGFILGLSWLVLDAFDALARVLAPQPSLEEEGPAWARDRTRRALLQRVASAGIIGVTVALVLVQFDVVRHVGLSILASAGIAGVVLGLAAQKSLAGLIAGIQLSITQPIRLGDTILIDGEPGLVQDVFLTYAVIRFWDDRCVVVPLSRFIDQPFQNWTLLERDLWAVVLLHVKFTAPIELLRAKARELCAADPKLVDARCELQVSDSDMYGMVIRVRVSAKSPAEAWERRCAIREGLFTYLQTLDGGAHMG